MLHNSVTEPSGSLNPPADASTDALSGGSGGSALTRLLQILDMFTLDHPRVHVDEVVTTFAVGQSTAYRYLRELSEAGLVSSRGKGIYSLGRRIVELERMLQLSDPLLLTGKPVMDSLHPYCANRAFLLCTPYNDRVLCVYKVGAEEIVQAGKPMPIQRGRGTTFPLFRGAGSQIILAHLLPHQIKSLFLSSTEEIIDSGLGGTWKEFRTSLSAMRKQGHTRTLGRVNPDMYSIAVPILKNDARVAGSLLMLGAAEQAEESIQLIPMLQNKAAAISTALASLEDVSQEEVS
jgi:DNA-binding IclR family transcriptional regulator